MVTAIDVAKYFLAQVDEEIGDSITNLKLQKLVYYAQGFHLALYDKPLFEEDIEAWQHGPVIPSVYHKYKEHGSNSIQKEDLDFDLFDGETKDLLDEVYEVFGQFSAWKLRNMTHEEPTWKDVSSTAGVITHESMKSYFKTQINK